MLGVGVGVAVGVGVVAGVGFVVGVGLGVGVAAGGGVGSEPPLPPPPQPARTQALKTSRGMRAKAGRLCRQGSTRVIRGF